MYSVKKHRDIGQKNDRSLSKYIYDADLSWQIPTTNEREKTQVNELQKHKTF